MPSTSETLSGSCLCGAVRFRVETPTLWCAHCHCTMCQRAHGAAFVTWVGAAVERAHLEGSKLLWYRSSEKAERGFCAECGSSLFFRSRNWPGEVHIVRANIDGAIDREPQSHAFYDSRVAWFHVDDTLPKNVPQPPTRDPP